MPISPNSLTMPRISFAVVLRRNPVEEGGLAGAEIAGKHGHRDLGRVLGLRFAHGECPRQSDAPYSVVGPFCTSPWDEPDGAGAMGQIYAEIARVSAGSGWRSSGPGRRAGFRTFRRSFPRRNIRLSSNCYLDLALACARRLFACRQKGLCSPVDQGRKSKRNPLCRVMPATV